MKNNKIYHHAPPEDALNRFMMISKVLCREHNGDTRPEAISEVAKEQHFSPAGRYNSACERTL